MTRKGIILAGGAGTRLYPLTRITSKQLLPVYDKPMIYYPLSLLMLAGIKEILIITTVNDRSVFESILGDGSHWGLSLTYATQSQPNGIPEAYIIAEEFLNGHPSMLILGDNIIIGHALSGLLQEAAKTTQGATVFEYRVRDPERFGVLERDSNGRLLKIWEKPDRHISNYAIVGMYFLDEQAPAFAKSLKPSARGETEIVDLLQIYLDNEALKSKRLGRGFAWFDTGTYDSLLDAGNFVRSLCSKQGLQVGCPTEIAYRRGWVNSETVQIEADRYHKTEYGKHLAELLEE